MSRRKWFRRLGVEALEDRRVCATNLGSGLDPGSITLGPPVVIEPDGVLSASLQSDGVGGQFVQVDGSDNRDVVHVLSFTPGTVTIQLEMFVGDQLVTNEIKVFQSTKFRTDGGAVVAVDAKGGNDEIRNDTAAKMNANGGDGNDVLYAGTGGDALQGGANNDTLIGRGGNDFLDGGNDDDYIRGGAGNDIIFGGSGNDLIYGDQGNDSISGDGGDDTMGHGRGRQYQRRGWKRPPLRRSRRARRRKRHHVRRRG